MIVLDTHAWLWWIRGDSRLGAEARRAIADAATVYIPAICCWEVGMLATKGRLGFVAGESVGDFVREALSHSRVLATRDAAIASTGVPGLQIVW